MDNVVVDLSPQDLLAVEGEDSGKFLQGQLTCNVPDASDTHCLPGAMCNNKGRVLGSFLLHRLGAHHFLVLRPGALATVKANLDRYIVFYKAKTRDARDDFRRYGLLGEEARKLLADSFPALPAAPGEVLLQSGCRLVNRQANGKGLPRYELWLPAGQGEALEQRLATGLSPAPLERWELEDLRQGLYFVGAEDSAEHTPQALNYDLADFVSFRKGCYTGQEIVARMHYRGSAKRRLFPVRTGVTEEVLPAGGALLDAAGEKAGECLRLLPAPAGHWEGLALLDIEKAKAGGLRFEQSGREVEIPLPAEGFAYVL